MGDPAALEAVDAAVSQEIVTVIFSHPRACHLSGRQPGCKYDLAGGADVSGLHLFGDGDQGEIQVVVIDALIPLISQTGIADAVVLPVNEHQIHRIWQAHRRLGGQGLDTGQRNRVRCFQQFIAAVTADDNGFGRRLVCKNRYGLPPNKSVHHGFAEA